MTKKNTLVEVKQAGALTEFVPVKQSQDILAGDIVIPKLLLMQGLSELVDQRKAQTGDMVRSTTGEKIGDPEVPVDFIPLKMTNHWVIQEKAGSKFEYRATIDRNASNELSDWTFFKTPTGQEVKTPGPNTIEWKRVKVINVYALLPVDIQAYQAEMKALAESGEMPDLNKTLLPIVISFRSTSFNAGKSVATFFAKLEDALQYNKNVRPFHYALTLEAQADKNDKGSFYTFQVSGKTKKVDPALLKDATKWYETLGSLKEVKIDTAGEDDEAPTPAAQTQF